MATQSLRATSRFKTSEKHTLAFAIILLAVSQLGVVARVYASAWYTVKEGGVLSGGQINNPSIPSSPTSPYEPEAIQYYIVGHGRPSAGVLISSGSQNVKAGGSETSDPFIKNSALVMSLNRYDIASMASGITDIISGDSCTNPTLDPDRIYKASASCVSNMVGYSLSTNGLVVVVTNDPTATININNNIIQSDSRKRLVILTNSVVAYDADVAMADISVLSTNTSSFKVQGTVEGPIIAKSNTVLPRDAGELPGAVVTFNPTYLIELSKKGPVYTNVAGLYESKVNWRYD